METESLKSKAIVGTVWELIRKLSSQAIGLLVSIVLARLLSPDDFGLVAMTSIFLNIANAFSTSGLGSSLVQKKDADSLDCDTVFWAGSALSVVVYAILFITAPLIANMYHSEPLIWILRVQGLILLLSGITSVQNSVVYRNLDFKKFFYRSLISSIISGIVGFGMAFLGYGYWALIGYSLSSTVVGVIILWRIIEWRPQLRFSWERLKNLYKFGLNLTIAELVGTFFEELKGFLIGLKFTPADLAFNNRGNSLPALLSDNIKGTIASVLFPVMSKLQDSKESVKGSMRRSMMTTTYIIAPMMVLLAVMSEGIILVLYTEKWLQAVPYMQVICFHMLFSIIAQTNLQAIKSVGRSDIILRMEFIKKPIFLAILMYTVTISPLAMTIGCAIYSLIAGIINAFPNKKLIGYSYREQLRDIMPNILLSLVVGVLVFFISYFRMHIILTLFIQTSIGIGFYWAASKLFRIQSLDYIEKTVKEIRKRNNN